VQPSSIESAGHPTPGVGRARCPRLGPVPRGPFDRLQLVLERSSAVEHVERATPPRMRLRTAPRPARSIAAAVLSQSKRLRGRALVPARLKRGGRPALRPRRIGHDPINRSRQPLPATAARTPRLPAARIRPSRPGANIPMSQRLIPGSDGPRATGCATRMGSSARSTRAACLRPEPGAGPRPGRAGRVAASRTRGAARRRAADCWSGR